jgi:hypothetical protein
MRAHLVVVLTPILDHDLCLIERVEDFAVEQFVSQLSVEALAVAVLPGASRFDVGGLGADRGDPVPNSLSDELGPIVGSDMNRNAAQDKKIAQDLDDVSRFSLRATLIAKLSLVNSSMMHNIRNAFPS